MESQKQDRGEAGREDEARRQLRDRHVIHVDRIEDDRPDRAASDLASVDVRKRQAEDHGSEERSHRVQATEVAVVPGERDIIQVVHSTNVARDRRRRDGLGGGDD